MYTKHMFKQTSTNRWLNTNEIESLTIVANDRVQVMTVSGRIHLSDYPLEYFLFNEAPVGIEEFRVWQQRQKKLDPMNNVSVFDERDGSVEYITAEEYNRRKEDDRLKKLKGEVNKHTSEFKQTLDEELGDL